MEIILTTICPYNLNNFTDILEGEFLSKIIVYATLFSISSFTDPGCPKIIWLFIYNKK